MFLTVFVFFFWGEKKISDLEWPDYLKIDPFFFLILGTNDMFVFLKFIDYSDFRLALTEYFWELANLS